jgi:hypothetical protein
MQNNNEPSKLVSLDIDRNTLLVQLIRLQHQVLTYESEIVTLLQLKQLNLEQENMRALEDKIAGCETEIQSLFLRISQLKAKMPQLRQPNHQQDTSNR